MRTTLLTTPTGEDFDLRVRTTKDASSLNATGIPGRV
jgi:hypothetical protein